MDSNGRAHPVAADVSPKRSGRGGDRRPSYGAARRAGSRRASPPVRRVLPGFVPPSPPTPLPRGGEGRSKRATVRGPTKRKGVGLIDARRVAGSTVTRVCHSSTQSVAALSTSGSRLDARLVGVRPLSPQLGVQLPGPGLLMQFLRESFASPLPSIFSPPRLPQPRLGSRGGEKMRHAPFRPSPFGGRGVGGEGGRRQLLKKRFSSKTCFVRSK
jgi:hypothetical protein